MTPAEFRAQCSDDGWDTPVDKQYPANDLPPLHTHDFDATVLITEGDLHMVYETHTDVLIAGSTCVVPAGTLHSEQPGPTGAVGLLAIRTAPGAASG